MALFVPGGVAAGGTVSGKLGGIVFSRNRFGAYMRARIVPVNPNTVFQQAVRNRFSTLTNRWFSVLDAAQRAGWDLYAANVGVTGRLGLVQNNTGQNWYIACNAARQVASLALVDDAPIAYTLASYTIPVLTATSGTASNALSFAFTNTDDWAVEVGGAMLFFMGRPQNATVNFFKGPYRFVGHVAGAVVPPTSPKNFADTVIPFPIGANTKVFCRAMVVKADGRIGAPAFLFDLAA